MLRTDFQDHYARGRDVWTAERAMREAPRLDAAILADAGCRVTGIDLVESPE